MLFERETPKTPFGNAPNPEQSSVQIKGRPGALEIILDEEAPLMTILRDMHALLGQNQAMLEGVAVRLNFGDRPLDRLQFGEIKRILDNFGLRLQRLDLTTLALEEFLEDEFGVTIQIKNASSPQTPAAAAVRSTPAPRRYRASFPAAAETD